MAEIIQGSDAWFAARLGKATASSFKKVLAKIKTGEAADRRNYRAQLVCERLTGRKADSYTNEAMRWGIEQEPFARIAYIAATGAIVQEVGFVDHPELMAGCSPDGLVSDDGLIEIKCPTQATHIETLKAQKIPSDHIPQVQGQIWITGRKWCDFISYHPEFPEGLQLFVVRVQRDDEYIKELETEVSKFLAEVDAEVETLKQLAA